MAGVIHVELNVDSQQRTTLLGKTLVKISHTAIIDLVMEAFICISNWIIYIVVVQVMP